MSMFLHLSTALLGGLALAVASMWLITKVIAVQGDEVMQEVTTRDWEDLNRRVAKLETLIPRIVRLEDLMHGLVFNDPALDTALRHESDTIGAKAIDRATLEQKGKSIPIRPDGTPNIEAIYDRDYDHG
jgi:hypothetical protein